MITSQQQKSASTILIKMLDPKDTRLTPIEKVALRTAIHMLQNDPTTAGKYADAMDMLVEAQKRKNDSSST